MGLGKQAKILTTRQQAIVLRYLETTRHPERDRVMFLLSVKAGFRSKEISALTWAMVTDANGHVSNEIALEDRASKGKRGGRQLPMHTAIQDALRALQAVRGTKMRAEWPVVYSERERGLSAASVTNWFARLYQSIGFEGCSSHSGRRTFITNAARRIVEAGGSLRDVQQLAGHQNLNTTMGYIEGCSDAKRRVVDLL